MKGILKELCNSSARRAEERQRIVPLAEVKRAAAEVSLSPFAFERALEKEGLSLICEVKKASPSKGIIDPSFDYMSIANDYVTGGADCISCLTEPTAFLGSEQIFREIRAAVNIPMLRKDFTVSAYQVYEARAMGADAVLLICSALDDGRLKEFFGIAESLKMTALFECRSEEEIARARQVGARVIGVNNRNLSDFSVDFSTSERLRSAAGRDIIFVAESGISSPEDAKKLAAFGADACLVGEYLMRSPDRAQAVRNLKECSRG